MSENTTAARTVVSVDRGKLDVQALVLLAVLLAAGFILNFTVGRMISSISGGLISPEFIISAFCLTIAAVIQLTTTSPFVDFAAEGIAAMLMAVIVRAGIEGPAKRFVPLVGSFVTTVVSGVVFMLIRIAMVGAASELAAAMLPVVVLSAVFNAILVSALYLPIRKALGLSD